MYPASITAALACLVSAAPIAAQTLGRSAARTPDSKPRSAEVFVAVLEGAYAVPPVDTHATGTAELRWTGTELQYRVDVDSISDVTGAFIHIGHVGATAPAVADLFDGRKAGPVSGLLASGTLRRSALHGTTLHRLVRALRDHDAYVTVHMLAHPGGELRGRLRIQPVVASR
jgi:hypothetical protein